MRDILIGIGLCYVAIRYGFMRPPEQRHMMLGGGVGVALCVLMILLGIAIAAWGLIDYLPMPS